MATKALEETPKAKTVVLKWAAKIKKNPRWGLEQLAVRLPWGVAGALTRFFTWKTPPGSAVLFARQEENIAQDMADVYREGAQDLDKVGARDWGEVLWSAYETMGGVKERARDIAIDETAKDVADKLPKAYGGAALVVALAALAILAFKK